MMNRLTLSIAVGIFVVAGATAYAAMSDRAKCVYTKEKAAGKVAFDLLRAVSRNAARDPDPRLSTNISKAWSTFTQFFAKADEGGGCPVEGDVADVKSTIDECVNQVISLVTDGTVTTTTTTSTTTLPPCGNGTLEAEEQCDEPDFGGATCESLGFTLGGTLSCTAACQYDVSECVCADTTFPATGQTTAYQADKNDGITGAVEVRDDGWLRAGAPLAYVDNGDGTITDVNTGLMWEKKSDDGALHDKDNAYYWSGDGTQETIWDWIDDVNAEGGTGFAGYSDWRVPNRRELESILDLGGQAGPAVDPVFENGCVSGCTVTSCSCTVTSYSQSRYWSSSSSYTGYHPNWLAWHLGFTNGRWDSSRKDLSDLPVRAVRGGL